MTQSAFDRTLSIINSHHRWTGTFSEASELAHRLVDLIDARVGTLELENADLRRTLAGDEKALWALTNLFRLTWSETRVLGTLLHRQLATKEALYSILYPDERHLPDPKTIDVFICKLRKKLPAPVRVETLWGRGYQMPKASKDYIKGEIDAYIQAN